MTIPATPRRSPVYVGNGTATDYAFAFKATDPATLVVTVADANDLNSQVLVNGVDYTVTLNGDQSASPGGSISYAGLPVGHRLVITSDTDSSQPTAISNLGAFHANVLEGALDRIVILHQQQQEQLDRCVKVVPTSEQDPTTLLDTAVTNASNYAAAAAASAAAAALIPGPSGSANVGFLQSGAGAVARSVQAKLRDTVSVKDFGATGDGTTDDTAAIQQAATAAAGGALYFPAGTYIGADISLPGGMLIFGPGVLKTRAQASLEFKPYFRLTAADVAFDGLTFDGNKAAQFADSPSDSWNTGANNTGKANRSAIYGDNSGTGYTIKNVSVRGCKFVDQWSASVALRNVSGVILDGNTFEDCYFECGLIYASGATRNTGAVISNNRCVNIGSGHASVNANAFVLTNFDGAVVANNFVATVERNFLKMENCTRVSVSGNVLDTNTAPGFNCLQGQSGAQHISVVGNVFRNVQKGIYFQTGTISDIVISNNVIEGGVAESGVADGIAVVDASGVVISGNTINGVKRHGIYVANTSSLAIRGNRITPAATFTGTQACGILISATSSQSEISIGENMIDAGFLSGSSAGPLAVETSATITRLSITGNIVNTRTNAQSDRGIRVMVGVYVDAIVSGNVTPGIIECASTVTLLNNVCGRAIPSSSGSRTLAPGSAAPTSGQHYVGEIQYHSAPAAGGNIGWVCTSGGTPGTWKTFGAIAP